MARAMLSRLGRLCRGICGLMPGNINNTLQAVDNIKPYIIADGRIKR
jgi:hypothetical protein